MIQCASSWVDREKGMRIISRKPLKQFWEKHVDAKDWLEDWCAEAKSSTWRFPEEIKKRYSSASILSDNRVVFNVCGNRYRRITKVHYGYGIIYIRFVGTHTEYDKVNANLI